MQHLERARTLDRRAGQLLAERLERCVATIDPESTSDSRPTSKPRGEWRRQGDVSVVSFSGLTVHVNHSKGMQDLATLLAPAPARAVHVSRRAGRCTRRSRRHG